MKLTDDEISQAKLRAETLINELAELTGSSILLLLEIERSDGMWNVLSYKRGSPYSSFRMAELFTSEESNRDAAHLIADAINSDGD